MRALVEQNAAAFAFPCCSPGGGVVVGLGSVPVGDDPDNTLQLTELTALNHFTHLLMLGVGALVVHDTEGQLRMCLCDFVHFHNLLGVNTDRLFGEDMQTCFKCFDGDDRMQIVRRCDQNCVDLAGCKHFLVVGVGRNVGTVLFGNVRKAIFLEITDRCQNRIFNMSAGNRFHMSGTHITDTDNTKSYFFHVCSFLSGIKFSALKQYRIPFLIRFILAQNDMNCNRKFRFLKKSSQNFGAVFLRKKISKKLCKKC